MTGFTDPTGLAEQTPTAWAVPTSTSPIDAQEQAELVRPYATTTAKSMAEYYRGPAWINSEGLACIVMIAPDAPTIRRARREGKCAFVCWRWNDEPSCFFSLTMMVEGGTPRPHARWMRPSEDPLIVAIRRHGRFLVTVTTIDGISTGWMIASFPSSHAADGGFSFVGLKRMWAFPTAGISYSSTRERFDPKRREHYNEDRADEIPLWPEPESDFWSMLSHDGPWTPDLTGRDKARAAWGSKAVLLRERAAGAVQVLIERQTLDGVSPLFDATGAWIGGGEVGQRVAILVGRAPKLGAWLVAVAGPAPDAKTAYDAAYAALNDPYAAFCLLDKLIELLHDIHDDALAMAMHGCFEAALLDARVTHVGRARAWFSNAEDGYGLVLRAAPFDLDAPIEDVESTWASASEMDQLLDLGDRVGPHDFVVPFASVCEAFERMALDGPVEAALDKVQELLTEAQDARQWSIPWGARVEVSFGPFTAVRIFEREGEFSCHFLDANERYFLVSIGLQRRPPRASSTRLVRHLADAGEVAWNEDAEVSLMLIAAAIVRDFVVVEEREALFSCRPLRRRVRGRDLKTVIYLPRVRYSKPDFARLALANGDASSTGPNSRGRHAVGQHLRKAERASATQRFLALRYGVQLPDGFTFVRPHERGGAAEQEQIRVYRSRSASRMIFEEVGPAPAGTRPAWFDFEKDCARVLTARGMKVIHQAARRDGDGGVDLYAVDTLDTSWVVQCKCWAAHRPIGPDVVRELAGAIMSADKGKSVASRGLIITTSRLTLGAMDAARTYGFEVLQGDELAGELQGL